jgi:hypothetical protein
MKKIVNNPQFKILIKIILLSYIASEFNTSFLPPKGKNNNIDLKNFNGLYAEKAIHKNEIILKLGEIIEQNCKQINELYYYNYKIKIENKTIPKILETYKNDYDLKPYGLDNNKYNITCTLENNSIDNYINCSLTYYKEISNALYYEQKYIYKKEINNYRIYIKNDNVDLYIGRNIKCNYVNKNIINNIRILDETDSDEEYSSSDELPSTEITTTHYTLENDNCISTCEKCFSFNNCTKCRNGYFLNNSLCSLCSDGCVECSDGSNCTKCFKNSILDFKLSNVACIPNEKEQNSTEDSNTKEIKLKYERMDSYKKQDNKVFFKTHFWVLNSFLYGAKLTINAIINFNANILRHLDSIERNIDCTQYFDDDYPVYLINFQCAFDFDNSQSLKSIKPNSFIINGNKDIDIQNNQTKDITIEELMKESLESEYKDYNYNKFLITTINDIKLQKQLTFNIKGEFDTKPKNDDQYKNIIIKKNNNQQITGNCEIKAKSDYLSCSFSKDNIKNKEILEIEEGMYKAEQNKEILIISNLNNKKINVPKKSISVGAIVGITIAGIVILIPIIFFLAKYLMSKNENNGMNQYNERELQIARNEIVYNNMNSNDNSKQVIYN